MYLPHLPGDPTNAAARLAQLELASPLTGSARAAAPLFPADEPNTPMSHAQADDTFNALATVALGPATAMTLSLHSGRVWLATALLARNASTPTIQAMVRWLSPAAIRIYAHMTPADYERTILRAISAPITARLALGLPQLDADRLVSSLAADAENHSDQRHPRRWPDQTPDQPTHSDDDSDLDCEVADAGLCDAGPLITDFELRPGTPVAIPLRMNGAEVHYRGVIRSRSSAASGDRRFNIKLHDGPTWVAARNRLSTPVELGD